MQPWIWPGQKESLEIFKTLELTEQEKEMVLWENASLLFFDPNRLNPKISSFQLIFCRKTVG